MRYSSVFPTNYRSQHISCIREIPLPIIIMLTLRRAARRIVVNRHGQMKKMRGTKNATTTTEIELCRTNECKLGIARFFFYIAEDFS